MTISKRKMCRQFESNPLVLGLLFCGCSPPAQKDTRLWKRIGGLYFPFRKFANI